jgi:membrane protein required for colicin V production
MIIDIILLMLLAVALFKGFRNGFIVAIFSFLAFMIGLAAAIKLSAVAADYIGASVNVSQRWLPFIAFAVVFLGVVLLVRLGAKALESMAKLAMLGWANRLGGILFYGLLYIFIFSIVLFYADGLKMVKPETANESVSYNYIKPLGPKVVEGLGTVIPIFKDMFAELQVFFGDVAKNEA